MKDEEKEEEKVQQLRQRLSRMIEEEMKHMAEDDPDIAVEELKWAANMKRMMEEPSEEDEILQTKVISTREVAKSWKSWLEAIDAEVHNFLEEKEALKKITRKELAEIQKKAAQEGRTVEIIPSKFGQQPVINGLVQLSTSRLHSSTRWWMRTTKKLS